MSEPSVTTQLKQRALILAGYLAPYEEMTAEQAAKSLGHLIAEVYSDKGLSSATGALIAVELACFIDEVQRNGRLSIAP